MSASRCPPTSAEDTQKEVGRRTRARHPAIAFMVPESVEESVAWQVRKAETWRATMGQPGW